MSNNWRVLFGVAGAGLVLFTVLVYSHTRFSTLTVSAFVGMFTLTRLHAACAYVVSAGGFFLIGAGAIGGKSRPRNRLAYLLAAHILAAVLLIGVAVCWEVNRPKGLTYD